MTDRFSNFADLAEHYAREIATPDYARAFMEQTELAKLSIEHEPSAAEMPDPEVAQAAIEMMLATVFDLFRDTRMEDFASEVAWGIANSFQQGIHTMLMIPFKRMQFYKAVQIDHSTGMIL